MAETYDTIDGLIAEFRGYAAGMPPSYHVTMSWADFRRMLDRFWAAHDHDVAIATEATSRAVVGACVKQQEAERKCVALREALAPFPSLCDWLVVNASKLGILDMVAKLRERGDKARAALAQKQEGGANG